MSAILVGQSHCTTRSDTDFSDERLGNPVEDTVDDTDCTYDGVFAESRRRKRNV